MRRLSEQYLRKVIREEKMRSMKRSSLSSLLFEQEDEKKSASDGMVDISAGPESVLRAVGELVKDPEKKKMMLSGLTDGDPKDEVITITPDKKAAKDLYPTQSEIGSSQSLDDQIMDKFKNLDVGIKGGKVNSEQGAFPILTFDNKILDGHHRWSQVYATNPNAVLDIAKISAPGVTDEKSALGLVHTILLALYGKSPTKPFKGQNLFSMSSDEIKKYVKENIVDSALKKLADAKLIPNATDKDAAADMYAKNLDLLKKNQGAYSRTVMPQPLDAGDKTGLTTMPDDATSGKINFKDPKSSDVKESKNLNDEIIAERWLKLAGILKD